MGPLYFLSRGYWVGRFRDVLTKKRIIYTSLPGNEDGTAQNGSTWYKPRRAIVNAVMAALVLALLSFLTWSAFAKTQPAQHDSPLPAVCDTPKHGYNCSARVSHQWGQYSPFFAVPSEISPEVPAQCTPTFAQILSRHGARDPTFAKSVLYRALIAKIHLRTKTYHPDYAFIKSYRYALGADQLTPFGKQEMIHSGTKFYTRYRSLVDADRQQPPFIRASSQKRVVESAENWSRGFHQALVSNSSSSPPFPYDILTIPERPGSNNTLNNKLCTSWTIGRYSKIGSDVTSAFLDTFAPPIAERLNLNLVGANLKPADVPLLMDLCAYETVASQNGATISRFCSLFTIAEWAAYDYYQSLGKWYGFGPGNPLGPTQGVGWVNELLARLTGRPVEDGTSTNRTTDADERKFPLGRRLYADFSHDNDMMGILGALGVYDDGVVMPNGTVVGPRENGGFSAAWAVPFAARIYVEKMRCGGGEEWVRVLVNDRVMPMKSCGSDGLGRCRLDRFVEGMGFARKGGRWDLCFK
ncbi:histidine phosphatase superfamily [Cercophora newfieldiana]|uniref:Phytase A n=1 Tax=Cercophora newfieldiana TaxID=92897 RepID=A0AA39Y430_9PEZI|nr:histidine phosphatase superfamily [Cercophora newfieldiana]